VVTIINSRPCGKNHIHGGEAGSQTKGEKTRLSNDIGRRTVSEYSKEPGTDGKWVGKLPALYEKSRKKSRTAYFKKT